MLRLLVDFNAMSQDGKRVRINMKHGNSAFKERLRPGLKVLLSEPDLEVEAVLELEIDEQGREWWYGVIDWSTMRDLPYP